MAAFLQYDTALEQVLQAKMRAADEERQRTGTGGGNKRRPGNSGEDAAWWTKEVCAAGWCVVLCGACSGLAAESGAGLWMRCVVLAVGLIVGDSVARTRQLKLTSCVRARGCAILVQCELYSSTWDVLLYPEWRCVD
jgi:hypothetical protein